MYCYFSWDRRHEGDSYCNVCPDRYKCYTSREPLRRSQQDEVAYMTWLLKSIDRFNEKTARRLRKIGHRVRILDRKSQQLKAKRLK